MYSQPQCQLLDASTKGSLKNSAVQLPVGGAGQGLKPIRPWGFPRCGRDTHFALWRHPPPLIPQRRSRPSPVPSFPPSPVARLNLFLLQNPRSNAISLRHHRPLHLLCCRRSASFAALARSASDTARSIARARPRPGPTVSRPPVVFPLLSVTTTTQNPPPKAAE
ncbi:uncharacterized protein TrAtP1_000259 [Trichoderma atroviride]|uniref:uncharacterized protein n=1 Tax=Hypocrea atroviridis TaxID=63577 RepID=UPI003331D880|nr:hypothetical protein TrAtP1_000259 [Trichoderma atroviride]